jgi:hypothetical protein
LTSKTVRKIQWLLAGLIWCYIIYRAFTIAITQDEAYTYFLVKTNNWRQMPGTANTHWLNSIFTRLFLWLPGIDNPWKLRLFQVLCWPLFSWCVIQYCSLFRNQWIGYAFFAALMFNPLLLLYFSLARGYAPGCTLLLLSLVLAAKYLQQNDFHPRKWVPVFIVGALVVLANFSFFYCYIFLSGIYLLHLYRTQQLLLLKSVSGKIVLLLIAGTHAFAIISLLLIRHSGDLNYGARSALIDSIIGSLITEATHLPAPVAFFKITAIVLFVLLLVLFAISAYSYAKYRQLSIHKLAIGMAVGIIAVNVLLNLLFKTPFLLGRTALIFYIPLVAGVAGCIDELSYPATAVHRFPAAVSVLLVLVTGYNFYKGINVHYFTEWPIQADTKKCLIYLKQHESPKTGMDRWHRGVYVNYYTLAYPDSLFVEMVYISQREVANTSPKIDSSGIEYLLLSPPYDKRKFPPSWKEILYYPDSKALLLKVR